MFCVLSTYLPINLPIHLPVYQSIYLPIHAYSLVFTCFIHVLTFLIHNYLQYTHLHALTHSLMLSSSLLLPSILRSPYSLPRSFLLLPPLHPSLLHSFTFTHSLTLFITHSLIHTLTHSLPDETKHSPNTRYRIRQNKTKENGEQHTSTQREACKRYLTLLRTKKKGGGRVGDYIKKKKNRPSSVVGQQSSPLEHVPGNVSSGRVT